MLKMRSNMLSAISSLVFVGLGLGLGFIAHFDLGLMVGSYVTPVWLLWTATGASFLLAFSSARLA